MGPPSSSLHSSQPITASSTVTRVIETGAKGSSRRSAGRQERGKSSVTSSISPIGGHQRPVEQSSRGETSKRAPPCGILRCIGDTLLSMAHTGLRRDT
jgi:hypothetical protein